MLYLPTVQELVSDCFIVSIVSCHACFVSAMDGDVKPSLITFCCSCIIESDYYRTILLPPADHVM